MNTEQLVRSVIGCMIILALGFVTYTFMKHSDQAELMTQNESSYESAETEIDEWEVDSTVATETARTGDGVTYTDAQGEPDLSNVKNTNDSPMNDERSSDTYRTFQNSHVPYSRSIADVFPVTGTPAYRLEYKRNDDLYSEEFYDEYDIGCPSDYSVTISLTKFDPSSKRYRTIVDDVCFFSDGQLIHKFYPVWSRDERYVAFVNEKTFTFDIFNPETTQILSFIDTKNLQEGVQGMPLPGYSYAFSWPRLAFDFSTVRKTEDGHIQVIGIGTWDYQRDGYVYVFDFTDWSLKQILNLEPNDDVLMGAEWAGERAIRAYTVSADIVKKCEDAILDPIRKSSGGKITSQAFTPEYYNCRKINASNFSQIKTHTIPF
jgi:hypothetical protein